MKERPILFSAPMVRALLCDAKTQTRRLVKPQPLFEGGGCWFPAIGKVDALHYANENHWKKGAAEWCPYGAPGDRLWVKETHALYGDPNDAPNARPLVACRATDEAKTAGVRWRPSIHMPRWASRLTLEVTGVRVERLQAITEADAKAEGVRKDYGRSVPLEMSGFVEPWYNYEEPDAWVSSAAASFASLWRSINGAESWAANPWVWVVSFRRVTNG